LKFKGFRFKFIFNLNVVFTTNFLKMAPILVRFSPGFPPGGGFHGEEFAQACFARHARAVKKGAFSTEAALACSQKYNFTGRNAPRTSRTTQRGQFHGEEPVI
jgi:hypothetical protein